MNETLSLEAPEMVEAGVPAPDFDSLDAESQADTPNKEASQTAERPIDIKERAAALDAWLTPLIAAHADVLVKAAWMGGAVSTLAEAIIAYPKKMVYEDQEALMAEINALIADRVIEPDTQESEDQTDEPQDAAEPEPEKANLDQKDSADKKTEESGQSKGMADDKEQERAQATAEVAKAADVLSNEAKSGSSSGDPQEERPSIKKEVVAEAVKVADPATVEVPLPAVLENGPAKPASEEEVDNKNKKDLEVTAEAEDIDDETVEAAEPVELVQSKEPAAAEIQAEKAPGHNEPEEAEEVIQLEAGWIMAETAEVLEAVIDEEEQVFEALDVEVSEQEFIDFIEGDEIIISHLADEAGPLGYEPIDLPVVEENQTEPADFGGQQDVDEAAVYEPELETVNEVVIEPIGEAEIADEAEEPLISTLEKIYEVPVPLLEADEDINEDARQKLENELEDLLDEISYEYAEETVEEITDLIMKKRLIEDIVKSKKDGATHDDPHDIGTHEAIKQILIGLAQGKTRLAPRLGKSAIKLYQASEFVLALAV